MRPALYLVPGLLCDATVWAHQVAALGGAWDIRIPDLRGLESFGAMAQSILADAPPRFALCGHSMGARVALEMLSRAPARVERLALLDTGVHPVRPGEAEKRQALIDLAEARGMAALADAWLPGMVHPDRLADAAFMASLSAMVERMSPEIFRRQVRALLRRPDAQATLSLSRGPTLVGVGRQDAWSPPEQHEAIAAAMPHARYQVFEHCGHMAPLEAPAAVAAALRDWLEQPLA